MDFFNSLTLDLKVLVIGIAGFALLTLFSGNKKAEKRYMLVLAVLAAAGVYRFNHVMGNDQAQLTASTRPAAVSATEQPKRRPLESTSAR